MSSIKSWIRLALFTVMAVMPAFAQSPVTLTRGPYLQSVTTDSIVIVWNTDVAADSRVDYGFAPGPPAHYGLTAADPTLVTHHAMTLTGLLPYTFYAYQVYSGGAPLGQASTFRTAAPSAQDAFSFIVFGDTRSQPAAHQSVVDRILTLDPGFVLHTGDLVAAGSDLAQWDTFFTIEQDLMRQVTLFPVPGNHEQNSGNYFKAFHLPGNERWYSFDYGTAHFVALQVDGHAAYAPGTPQYAWLENDLAASDKPWKFVIFHVPPYSSGPHGDDTRVQAALSPVFERYGVDIVFNGHDHDYERSIVNGITYLVVGGGGAPLYSQVNSNPYSIYFTSTLHLVSIAVNGNTLSAVPMRPDGVQFDPFTLTSRRPGVYPAYLPLMEYGPEEPLATPVWERIRDY